MEKGKALVALLMTFVIIIGIVTPCFADEDVQEYVAELTTEATTEETTEIAEEAITEPSTSEIAAEGESETYVQEDAYTAETTDGFSSILNSFFGVDGEAAQEAPAEEAESTVFEEPVLVEDAEAEEATEEDAEPAEEEAEEETEEETSEYVWSNISFINDYYRDGVPAVTTQSFTAIYRTVKSIANILQGRFLWDDDDIFDVTLDENFIEVCQYITDNTCLDVPMIMTNVPDLTEPAKIVNKVFQIDVTAMREELYAKRDELYKTDRTKGEILYLFTAYLCGIESAYIYLQPKGSVYEVGCDVTYSDGYIEKFHTGIYYNPETGEFYSNGEKGIGGTGFNSNVKDLYIYAPMYCWMRKCGFCFEYDLLCYVLPNFLYNYRTRRIKFDYAGKEWMIQMWKGNYLVTNGGEVGIYYREPGSIGTYYDVVSDEDRLPMSLKIMHGYDTLIDIPETLHWWVNGFKMGKRMYSPHSLTLISTIQFKDEEMLQAFLGGVDKNIYHDINYTVDGLTVTLVWDT